MVKCCSLPAFSTCISDTPLMMPTSPHPNLAVARRGSAIVRLAGLQVGDVLLLGLDPRGRAHVHEVVGQRRIERRPVLLYHRLEPPVVRCDGIVLAHDPFPPLAQCGLLPS